ncbi:methyltransferase domain-containing protein [uncultured Thiohalocapsa sp.]|uniref:class I SAM-dependent methyltransferase n=1 Tax=uncultured Thiohalocapsa sp. TaxID=768990 RepID=UPI0025CFF9AE|nr:methyltransferase domain-containing protein [uncultured Thiohalocapsa sp.]
MSDTTLPASRLRESLGYLNWLYNPFHGLDAAGIYDLLATSSPTERGLYLNLGYWQAATDLDAASDALAMLVGETAALGPEDHVLDCGFGFGDQDILWAQTLKPGRIIGLNITASQVEVARRRVSKLGLDDRIDLQHGSATQMPIAAESIDKVVAVECAFHFRSRERFLREAWRVLRPGGRLVLADIIPMPAVRGFPARLEQQLSWRLVSGKFAIPPENAYTRPTYHAKLAMSGFEQIRVESIREHVYAPLHRFLAEHPETLTRLHPMARLPAKLALRFEATSVYRGLDYVLATARKPKRLIGPGHAPGGRP